jgi:hypothetical protein
MIEKRTGFIYKLFAPKHTIMFRKGYKINIEMNANTNTVSQIRVTYELIQPRLWAINERNKVTVAANGTLILLPFIQTTIPTKTKTMNTGIASPLEMDCPVRIKSLVLLMLGNVILKVVILS